MRGRVLNANDARYFGVGMHTTSTPILDQVQISSERDLLFTESQPTLFELERSTHHQNRIGRLLSNVLFGDPLTGVHRILEI